MEIILVEKKLRAKMFTRFDLCVTNMCEFPEFFLSEFPGICWHALYVLWFVFVCDHWLIIIRVNVGYGSYFE